MAHLTDEQLIWVHYADSEDLPALEIHLDHCADCRARMQSVKADLLALEQLPVPERGPDYGTRTWRALVRRDASIASSRRRSWRDWLLVPHRIAIAGGLTAMLVAGFFAGRVTGPAVADPATSTAAARERILAVALSDHLEESARVLTEIANRDQPAGIDLAGERTRASGLLGANRLYRVTAARNGKPELASVLEDLERALLEIKNSPANATAQEWTRIRGALDEDLLFKVRVLRERLNFLTDQPIAPKPRSANFTNPKG